MQTLEELKVLCPDRNWRFIEINITKEELEEKRNNHIANLIYPLKTIIDDDLGCALWFASRGIDDSHCRVSTFIFFYLYIDNIYNSLFIW